MTAQVVDKNPFGNEIPAFPGLLGAGIKGMGFPPLQEGLLGLQPPSLPWKHLREGGLCLEFQGPQLTLQLSKAFGILS